MRGTWTLLEACRLHGAQRVVVAASDKAYGASATLPYREDMPLDPRYPYDVSKAATDMIARSYWHTFGLPVAVTRFANLYGGGDLNRSRLIPEAVGAALAGRAPGDPLRRHRPSATSSTSRTPSTPTCGSPTRSTRDARRRGEAFNAGGGRPHAVRDVVARICALAGTDVAPDVRGSGTPDGEIDRQYVDATKLRALTGWEPRVDLDEGLRRTIDWYRAHPQALA